MATRNNPFIYLARNCGPTVMLYCENRNCDYYDQHIQCLRGLIFDDGFAEYHCPHCAPPSTYGDPWNERR